MSPHPRSSAIPKSLLLTPIDEVLESGCFSVALPYFPYSSAIVQSLQFFQILELHKIPQNQIFTANILQLFIFANFSRIWSIKIVTLKFQHIYLSCWCQLLLLMTTAVLSLMLPAWLYSTQLGLFSIPIWDLLNMHAVGAARGSRNWR